MDDQTLLSMCLLIRLRRRQNRRLRTMCVRDLFLNRNETGVAKLIADLRNDPQYHFRHFRMDKANFDWILQRITPLVSHKRTHACPISALERLGITIRYLASGNSQISLAINYRVSPASICQIIRETTVALIAILREEFLPAPTDQMWKDNAKRFSELWNFPNCCGGVDGKHVRVKAPPASGSLYYNYKGFFSIVLMAISNADFKFSAVDIGAYGSESDGGILWRSPIGKSIQDGSLGLPQAKSLTSDGIALPHVLLGDDAFPLRTNMMKPYKGNFLPKEARIFNYRLSRARMVVENSFGILAARWRILHTLIEADVELTKQLVMAAVLLHNFLMDRNDLNTITPDRIENGTLIHGNWRTGNGGSDTGFVNVARQGSNNHTSSAASVRDAFKEYFVSEEGSVPWQDDHVDFGF